ncbi:MAG: hypothetical protein M1546_21800 [Chloroflexi bacterium]|nr:hypothetical protein [Chloroflexota bacterium]
MNYKPLRGLGVRELLLLGFAAGQAIYLVFIAESISFPVRLTLALFLAIILLAIATIPVRGYKVEYFLFAVLLRGLVRPRRYLHQTAMRDARQVDGTSLDETDEPQDADRGKDTAKVRVPARVGWGEWAAPNVALVMAIFVVILLAGSVIAYVSRAGGPPFQ